jgi:hypothetical protein
METQRRLIPNPARIKTAGCENHIAIAAIIEKMTVRLIRNGDSNREPANKYNKSAMATSLEYCFTSAD